jgi:hypothetical protein
MSAAQQAVFSGLYRVTKVIHNFDEGKFTQTLTMIRFNNQDGKVTSTTNQKITKKNGVVSKPVVSNPNEDRANEIISGTLGSS